MVDRAGNIVLEQQLSACAVIVLGDCLRAGRSAGMRWAALRRYEVLEKVWSMWLCASGFMATLGDTHCSRSGDTAGD